MTRPPRNAHILASRLALVSPLNRTRHQERRSRPFGSPTIPITSPTPSPVHATDLHPPLADMSATTPPVRRFAPLSNASRRAIVQAHLTPRRAAVSSISSLVPPSFNPPTLPQLLTNFASSLAAWSAAGFPIAPQSLFASRLAICHGCTHWKPGAALGFGRCDKCGCVKAKLWLATENYMGGKIETFSPVLVPICHLFPQCPDLPSFSVQYRRPGCERGAIGASSRRLLPIVAGNGHSSRFRPLLHFVVSALFPFSTKSRHRIKSP